MCQQFTISLSVKLQSQPHKNNPETLGQLGVIIHPGLILLLKTTIASYSVSKV